MPLYLPPTLAIRHPSDRIGLELALLEGPPSLLPAPVAPEAALSPRRSVLVVDEDGDLRGYVRSCLETDYWIAEAADGAAALAAVHRLRPALVVTDAAMPGVDGDTLCRALRADPCFRTIPILAISGARTALPQADAFLAKPFSRHQLLEAVQALLGRDL